MAVAEGWWHPSVKSGQVHDHKPVQPQTMHRLCVEVYTKQGLADETTFYWRVVVDLATTDRAQAEDARAEIERALDAHEAVLGPIGPPFNIRLEAQP